MARNRILTITLACAVLAVSALSGCRSGAGWRSFGWKTRNADVEVQESEMDSEVYPEYDEFQVPPSNEPVEGENYYPAVPAPSRLKQMSFLFLPKKSKKSSSVSEPIESERQFVPRPQQKVFWWSNMRMPWQPKRSVKQPTAQSTKPYPKSTEVNWDGGDGLVRSSLFDESQEKIALTGGEEPESNASSAKFLAPNPTPQTVTSNIGGNSSEIEDWPFNIPSISKPSTRPQPDTGSQSNIGNDEEQQPVESDVETFPSFRVRIR